MVDPMPRVRMSPGWSIAVSLAEFDDAPTGLAPAQCAGDPPLQVRPQHLPCIRLDRQAGRSRAAST